MITREKESAVIRYKEKGVMTTHLGIGPGVAGMTDGEILELYNRTLRAQAKAASRNKYVAVETPLGTRQLEYDPERAQWSPLGTVLRCVIKDDEDLEAVIDVDDTELRIEEFGRLLANYAGWGMRIEFVPWEEVHRRPALRVRQPHAK